MENIDARKDVNVFIGDKTETIVARVSKESKQAIKDRAKELGYKNVTDYLLVLIDKDFKNN